MTVDEAKALLEAEGYVVLRAKSYRQAQTRQAIAQAQVAWAEKDTVTSRNWARICLDRERQLGERCTYLYGLAASLGATQDQLWGER